jgi:hypothetical protein
VRCHAQHHTAITSNSACCSLIAASEFVIEQTLPAQAIRIVAEREVERNPMFNIPHLSGALIMTMKKKPGVVRHTTAPKHSAQSHLVVNTVTKNSGIA